MYFNNLLFHPPSSKYTTQSLQGKIIWIPKQVPKKKKRTNPKKKSKSIDTADRPSSRPENCTGIKLICTNTKRGVRDDSSDIHQNDIAVTLPEEKKSEINTRIQIRKESYPGASGHKKKPQEVAGRKSVNIEIQQTSGENKIDLEGNKESREKAISNILSIKAKQSAHKDDERKKVHQKGGCFQFFHLPKRKFSDENNSGGRDMGTLTLEKIKSLEGQVEKELEHESSSESDEEPFDPNNFEITYIPCLFLGSKFPTKKILVYFHGNNEDVSLTHDFLERLQSTFMVNVLAVEYPGYGIYRGKTSGRKLLADANIVYNYLLGTLKVEEKDIILFGRSIGTGAVCQLAAAHNPALLILISPFTSIRAVAKDFVGLVGQYLIKERFKNLQQMSQVTCPAVFIHGKKDTLIPPKHSQKLFDACRSKQKTLILRDEMTHNEFDFYDDLSVPVNGFMKKIGWTSFNKEQERLIFPAKLFEEPHV